MAINVREHRLVPKHEILSEEDKQKILEKYNITISDLPEISIKDPAIEGLKAKEGDLVKITRQSYTAGESIFYRKVITHG